MALNCPRVEAGLRPVGGCGFPVDPVLEAGAAPVFWRAEIAPAVVVRLAPVPGEGRHALSLVGAEAVQRIAEDGLHLRLTGGPQLVLPVGADLSSSMAAVLALDDHFPVQLAAAQRLYLGLRSGVWPAERLPPTRRSRLNRILRALDGRDAGASYRDIAEHVLGVRIAESAAWRTSSAREVAIRLCRAGARLVRGGYLALLRRRP